MKTIVENSTNESKYLLSSDTAVQMLDQSIVLPTFIVGDLNASNATLYKNVTPPEDWIGCKYLFDGTDWTLNPNWVDPNPKPE